MSGAQRPPLMMQADITRGKSRLRADAPILRRGNGGNGTAARGSLLPCRVLIAR